MPRLRTLALVPLLPVALVACGGEKGGADGEYCALIREYEDNNADFGSVFSDPSATPETVKTGIDALLDAIGSLRDAAPDDVKADVDAVAGTIEQMAGLLEKYDYNFEALAASDDVAELQAVFDSDEVAAAGERLDAYTTQVCGVTGD